MRPWRRSSTRACAAPISIPATSCAPRCWTNPISAGRTPGTTRLRWSTGSWSPETGWKSTLRGRAGAGAAPAEFEAPRLPGWPAVTWTPDASSTRVDLDRLNRGHVAAWKPGERLLLSGKLLTGRDAAHQRIQELIDDKRKLPVDFTNRVIYYVGPGDPGRDEAVGPAGPTTATRMDKFSQTILGNTGLLAGR